MQSNLKMRVLFLVLLAVIGISLGWVGTTLGAGDISDTDRVAEVSIVESNVTVTNADQTSTLTGNVSQSSDIEVRETGGTISVTTHQETPFTARERDHAIEIARSNRTIDSYLESTPTAAVEVKPIQEVNAESVYTATVNVDSEGNQSFGTRNSTHVYNVTIEDNRGSVTIDRTPTYVDDEASIWITPPNTDQPRYTVTVGLTNRTVTDLTDWADI